MIYYLNKIIWAIANPAVVGLAILLATVVIRKWRGMLLMVGLGWMIVWFLPITSGVLGYLLEKDFKAKKAVEYPVVDAIVDLGGGIGADWAGMGQPELSSSADRAYFSAQLWKAGKAPIVIPSTMGAMSGDGRFMIDLGVEREAIVAEDRAKNTEENAKYVEQLLRERKAKKILLVTSAWHMKRSLLMFEKYAPWLEVIPAPCDFECAPLSWDWRYWVSNPESFGKASVYFHEWLGYFGYKWLR